jgi:cell wall-associated NlpC family hydrolase
MFVEKTIRAVFLALASGLLALPTVQADEAATLPLQLRESSSLSQFPAEAKTEDLAPTTLKSPTLLQRTSSSLESTLNGALDLIGVRYRRGGTSPDKGFDCSGFVGHVFQEGLGLYLPHSAKEMSKTGSPVTLAELKPGDLVFFNTMRRAFSHVGIYLGDNQFVHAPRSGGKVRIEDLGARYWVKRFNGARRVAAE